MIDGKLLHQMITLGPVTSAKEIVVMIVNMQKITVRNANQLTVLVKRRKNEPAANQIQNSLLLVGVC
jgi:hypothetical protein